jgi:prepilin-type N-terminal cleavage/methylation domain-containing protein
LQPGFTLVEMTIVLLIVSILLAGVLMPLSMQMELRKYADTKKTMDQINEALIGFVLMNGRLPCPAIKTIADGTTDGTTNGNTNAGFEALTGNACTSITGVIPWATLNVPETDEWGGRFTYRVSSAFADVNTNSATHLTWGSCTPSVNPAAPTSFALCANGDMKVRSRNTTDAYDMTNVALPAVFISHGKNGYGAYDSHGNHTSAPPANADETTNATPATPGPVSFFSREKTDASSSCSDSAGTTRMCEFDDLVAFVPLTTLMNRMVVSGKLP